jgi:hypothetical protein
MLQRTLAAAPASHQDDRGLELDIRSVTLFPRDLHRLAP